MSGQPNEAWREIIQRLGERGANQPCPSCQRDEWIGMGRGGVTDTIALLSDQTGPDEPNTYPVVGLFCANCGFIRLHHRSVFE